MLVMTDIPLKYSAHEGHQHQECATPVALAASQPDSSEALGLATAGTTCTDVSSFGVAWLGLTTDTAT